MLIGSQLLGNKASFQQTASQQCFLINTGFSPALYKYPLTIHILAGGIRSFHTLIRPLPVSSSRILKD